MIKPEIDIRENEIIEKYPGVLDILLKDHSTGINILWATDNYEYLGVKYTSSSAIKVALITGKNSNVIMPRVSKQKHFKELRVKDKAEVFTPSWVCNAQNNKVDEIWFGRKNVFNIERERSSDTSLGWKVNKKPIAFPKNKTWLDYVKDKRLEITCGEAPYITSRYDITTGKFIPVQERIGLLDRKLRVVEENTKTKKEWLEAAHLAYKSIYGYEWQGDSLLLARESMLITFIENFLLKFDKPPTLRDIKNIAEIISWNVWQMDGLKGVVPKSCQDTVYEIPSLFDEQKQQASGCSGCSSGDIRNHTGIYCVIKDWLTEVSKDKKGREIKFIDILK